MRAVEVVQVGQPRYGIHGDVVTPARQIRQLGKQQPRAVTGSMSAYDTFPMALGTS